MRRRPSPSGGQRAKCSIVATQENKDPSVSLPPLPGRMKSGGDRQFLSWGPLAFAALAQLTDEMYISSGESSWVPGRGTESEVRIWLCPVLWHPVCRAPVLLGPGVRAGSPSGLTTAQPQLLLRPDFTAQLPTPPEAGDSCGPSLGPTPLIRLCHRCEWGLWLMSAQFYASEGRDSSRSAPGVRPGPAGGKRVSLLNEGKLWPSLVSQAY